MELLYQLRSFTDKYPFIWIILFVVLSIIAELIAYGFTKRIQKKSTIASIVISALITTTIAVLFNFLLGSPTIKNNASVIPNDIYRAECRIVLLDYYGEYYYLPESKNKYFINDDLKKQATKIELINKDYDVVFDSFTMSKNEIDENVYIFKDIPSGNYTLNAYVDGYMKRSETVVFDTAEMSKNYKTGEKWWSVRPVMVKNDAEETYPMNVWFLDHNENPIENIPYEFVASERNLATVYSYPKRTDENGSISELISIYDNTHFWIAYQNPITNETEVFCVTSIIDFDAGKCDAILMFDSDGKLKQTSPNELWH